MTKYEMKRLLRMVPDEFINKEVDIRGYTRKDLDGWAIIQILTEYLISLEKRQIDREASIIIEIADGNLFGYLMDIKDAELYEHCMEALEGVLF